MQRIPVLKGLLLALLLQSGALGMAQQATPNRLEWADSTVKAVRADRQMDNLTRLSLMDTAYQVFEANGDTCKKMTVLVMRATFLDNIGMPDSALACLYSANDLYLSNCDSAVLFFLYANYTSIFLSLQELNKLDSVANFALDLWNPDWSNHADRFSMLTNLAISYARRGEIETSMATFRKVYQDAKAVDDQRYIHKALVNMGTIKGMTRDYDSAYFFLNIAALNARDDQNISGLVPLLINLANVDMARKDFTHADQLLDSAYALAEQRVNMEMKANVLDNKAYLYEFKGDFMRAYDSLRAYTEVRENFLNEERVRAVADMSEKYQSALKARQIQQLQLEKLDSEVENGRIRNTRNQLLFLGGLVIFVAIGLWTRLRFVRKSRSALQKEKDVSDGLLLNILPAAVAEELKEKGHAEAQYFDTATIMFSDFKDFTMTASKMEAAALVEGVNTYFKAFDEITTKYGIEKIKTIGDAYMAAGGIDNAHPTAAKDVVCAAIEIQKFVIAQKLERVSTGQTTFDMRVGVHSGPVVAGIVGIKKFQYDLWGDTVNIASRMESNGVPEKINISEATYQLIKDDSIFNFESRGTIEVKGKGEMQMYFVDMI